MVVTAVNTFVPKCVIKTVVDYEKTGKNLTKLAPNNQTSNGILMLLDVSGFTKLSDTLCSVGVLGGEKLLSLLNSFFEALIVVADEHGGDILKFAGDALMISWTPTDGYSERDISLLSIQAALEMVRISVVQKADNAFTSNVDETARQLLEREYRLQSHIAIAFGELSFMILGGLGGRHEFIINGHPISEMGLAIGYAKVGEVVITPSTSALVEDAIVAEECTKGPGYMKVTDVTSPAEKPKTSTQLTRDKSVDITLRSFIPKCVWSQIHERNSENLLEFRTVSINFVGYTGLNQTSTIEELHKALLDAQTLLNVHGGMLRQFIVDDKGCVLITAFGVPKFQHADNAARAVKLAMDLQKQDSQCAIGICSGKAFCGSVGSSVRQEYAIVSDKVNCSARLMCCKRGPIVCDKRTVEMSDEFIKFETLGEIKLKGFDGPVEVFAPTGLSQSNDEGNDDAGGGNNGVEATSTALSVIAGREEEKKSLIDALHEFALSDVGNLFLLQGQAGFGKTSLVNFLRDMAVLLNVEYQYFSGLELENDTLYYLLRNMTFEFCGISREEHIIPTNFAQEVCGTINSDEQYHSKILMPVLSQFLNMDIGASAKDDNDREMDSLHQNPTTSLLVRSSAADQIVTVIKNKIFKVLGDRKYLFVFNDCHFFDGESWKLLNEILSKLKSSHLFLLTARPMVEMTPIMEETRDQIPKKNQIELKPLTDDAVKVVVGNYINLLGENFLETDLATVHETVMLHSKGNPFWVVQLCKLIRCNEGELVLELSGGSTESEKLENIVMQQFDQLTSHEQELLKTAAALGASFEINILTNLMPLRYRRQVKIQDQLIQLVKKDILLNGNRKSDFSYLFSHDILRKVIVDLTPPALQRKRHRQIAKLYEEMHQEDLRPYILRLAYHYDKSGQAHKSFLYLKLGALSALQMNSLEQGLSLLKRAMIMIDSEIKEEKLERIDQLIHMLRSCLIDAGVEDDADKNEGKPKKKKPKTGLMGMALRQRRASKDLSTVMYDKYQSLLDFLGRLEDYRTEFMADPTSCKFSDEKFQSHFFRRKDSQSLSNGAAAQDTSKDAADAAKPPMPLSREEIKEEKGDVDMNTEKYDERSSVCSIM